MQRLGKIVLGIVIIAAAFVAVAPAASAGTADEEQQFVALINDLRASKGLGSLSADAHLADVARTWAEKMVAANAISHNGNLGNEVTHNWSKLGENVGRGTGVRVLHDAFVDSPTHYRNLVDGDFTHIGVGVVHSADGTVYTTHVFMTLAGASPAPAPSKAPATEPTTEQAQDRESTSTPTPAPAAASQPSPSTAAAATAPATAPHSAPTQPEAASVDAPAGVSRLASVLSGLRALDATR